MHHAAAGQVFSSYVKRIPCNAKPRYKETVHHPSTCPHTLNTLAKGNAGGTSMRTLNPHNAIPTCHSPQSP